MRRYESIIATLCENLDTLDEPEAKASMIWIIGEYAERIDNADELLESFLETFPEETSLASQPVNLICTSVASGICHRAYNEVQMPCKDFQEVSFSRRTIFRCLVQIARSPKGQRFALILTCVPCCCGGAARTYLSALFGMAQLRSSDPFQWPS